jgi:hypothetical protein
MTIRRHEAMLDEVQGQKGRKRVQVDPNTKFAQIDQIVEALNASARRKEDLQRREPELEAKRAAEATARLGIQDMTLVFDVLNNMVEVPDLDRK